MSNFIEFKKISIIRDRTKILNNINLEVGFDENVVIMGPNGSGKSTFIKLLIGKIYPSYNKCNSIFKLFGLKQWNIYDLRSVLGVVTNELRHDFCNDITGLEIVLSGFFSSVGIFNNHIITNKMINKSINIIEFLELFLIRHKKIKTMSSGEIQMFLIARALVNSPKILILDEPSNGLDISSSTKLYGMMRKISLCGTKIILVTHLVSDIIPEINRFVFLKDGKIFADGKRNEVFNSNKLSILFGINIKLHESNGIYSISVRNI
jgi:iron complex transport system ATP-binding protein